MPNFDLDHLKETWQKQKVQPKYDSSQIEAMLNKSSRNYVKYILWISIAEFLLILGLNSYYTFLGDDTESFLNIFGKLGIHNTADLHTDFQRLYLVLKIASSLLTGIFVVLFYLNYKKINVESNLKKFILQIMRFKNTVRIFILANILLLVVFTIVLTFFIFYIFSQQHIELNNPTLLGLIVGAVLMTLISIVLIWLYYRIVYGILIKRLGKNLEELKKIEEVEE